MPSAPDLFAYTSAGAHFSPGRVYRYSLHRTWNHDLDRARLALWVMLNPSTADEWALDPTLRRCEAFSRGLGLDGFEVVNLFALRSTDPAGLSAVSDPVGPGNDDAIRRAVARAGIVLVGWGAHPLAVPRAAAFLRTVDRPVFCLGVTKSGAPKHPLYLRRETVPRRFAHGPGL